jgi:hypothetical protein
MAISLSRLKGLFAATGQASDTRAAGPARPSSARPPTLQVAKAAARDYRAVSIVSGDTGCGAAAEFVGKRFLVAEAPRLPLEACSNPAGCTCSYRKHADRRTGEDRRLALPGEKSAWYHGSERRRPSGRREED